MTGERSRGVFGRGRRVVSEGGVRRLLWKLPPFLYQSVYPYLPKQDEYGTYNGVTVDRRIRLFEAQLPEYVTQWTPGTDSEYEQYYVSLLRDHVAEGESVVAVGGGWGVSTVVAARQVGRTGDVTTFEGSASEVENVRRAVELNRVGDRASVRHAVVGTSPSLRGEMGDAEVVSPADLPQSDVLALDCDGAELPILRSLETRPSTIVVEHHGVDDDGERVVEFRPDDVAALLDARGYELVDERTAPHSAGGMVFYVARAT